MVIRYCPDLCLTTAQCIAVGTTLKGLSTLLIHEQSPKQVLAVSEQGEVGKKAKTISDIWSHSVNLHYQLPMLERTC